jgi:hypothetical protein
MAPTAEEREARRALRRSLLAGVAAASPKASKAVKDAGNPTMAQAVELAIEHGVVAARELTAAS